MRTMHRTPTIMTTLTAATAFAPKLELQHRLFSELSAMFGREVPLYDKSQLVNRACNRLVCTLLSRLYLGFTISDAELELTGGERHGAIRIGRPDEYRWIGRLFGCFAMEPHNYYGMTEVGSKSQPIIATAFRSTMSPEHRIFTSLLMTDYFDAPTKARIDALLAKRTVFSQRAKELVEKSERDGGLSNADGDALIRECTERIFKWTGKASDYALYSELSASGFKIAADIACFHSHHLNHLTPNTLCMDLYTAAMKHCMGEAGASWFEARARTVLSRLVTHAENDSNRDGLKLRFKHLSADEVARYRLGTVGAAEIGRLAADLTATLAKPEFALTHLKHAGFKDCTEGPSEDTPVFLRQDAYKALTEPVVFTENDGSTVHSTHTARFGEVEERFYACTPAGRALYDECLAKADAAREVDDGLPGHNPANHHRDPHGIAESEALYARPFAPLPKTLAGLLAKKFVYARFAPTRAGLAAREAGTITDTDLMSLADAGLVSYEGLRYEDFLPVSAAGIFASNLQQYGTKSTAAVKPSYSQRQLEEVLGRTIIDATAVDAGIDAQSRLATYRALGLLDRVSLAERATLEAAVTAWVATTGHLR